MFSTKEQLIKKTGKHGIGRFTFLQQLVNEYKLTKSRDSKEQVLANLANFAYDPVNYEYLWRLRVLDLFFEALEDKNKKIVSYALGGICNICLEPLSREYIIRNHGIKVISSFLSSNDEPILLSAITILIYLETPSSKNDITAAENIKQVVRLSESENPRIKNLAIIFLRDLCHINVNSEQNPRKSATISQKASNNQSCDKTKSTNTVASTSETASTSGAPY